MKNTPSFTDSIITSLAHEKLAHIRKEAKKDNIDVTFRVYDRALYIRVGKYAYKSLERAFSAIHDLQAQIDYSGEVRS